MSDIRYTKDHEWVRIDGEIATVGITNHAQNQLGDIVFVELPEKGRTVKAGDEIGVIESVKTAAEVYAPVSGEVTETNGALPNSPETVNRDPTGEGWFVQIRMSDPGELDVHLNELDYQALTGES